MIATDHSVDDGIEPKVDSGCHLRVAFRGIDIERFSIRIIHSRFDLE
jgi:hypothetical protein